MFTQTLSFCRRLLGKDPAASVANTSHDDRRLWVRYHADLETQIQLEPSDRLTGQIRDISVGGANLLTDRSFRPGQMLSVELPGDGAAVQLVLACVVRCTGLASGQWSIGCAFARELTTSDLERFGTTMAASPEDQRANVRHPSTLKATYQRVAEQDETEYTADVLNVSASGVGLLLREQLDPGSLISVQLRRPQGEVLRSILACVVHCTERANRDRVVGCNFIRELAEDELQALLL
jgi:c-di-GMP-binding flagellar brake protein YcgR